MSVIGDSSDDEVFPPEEADQDNFKPVNPEDEIKNLEAELAALEREEQRIREQEEVLSVKRTSVASSPSGNSSHLGRTGSFSVKDIDVNGDGEIKFPSKKKEDDSLLGKQLKTALNDPEYSDIALVSEGKKVHCHKAILAARCNYFRKTFETNRAAKEFAMKDMKYPVLIGVLEYIYTGNTTVHPDWVEALWFVSQAFELPELEQICDELLGDRKNVSLSRKPSAHSPIPIRQSFSFEMPEVETEKMREIRKKVALELFTTEKTYVKSLQTIFDEVVTPLHVAESSSSPILQKETKLGMFAYWEVLLRCHVNLLQTLKDRIEHWDSRPEIGDVFVEKTAFIKLYKHYVNNFDKSVMEYKGLKENNSRFREFIQRLEFTSKLSNLDLPAFLILPVQRIPRYVLLLQDLLKSTIPTHPDFDNLQYGLKIVKELADYINHNKSSADEINRILAIQDKMIGWPSNTPLVRPRRRIIKEGTLFKASNNHKLHVVLFSDALLYCKPKGKDKLKYKGLLLLTTSSINTNPKQGEKFHFEIISQSGKFAFNTSPEDKDIWLKTISDALEVSHSDLINSAFSGFEKKESEGSKQYQMLREEENMRKRSELAVQVRANEQEYVQNLTVIVEKFMRPLQAAIGQYQILSKEEITEIFYNVDVILQEHAKFVQTLEERVNKWDANSTMGDIFLVMVIDIAKLYDHYLEHHSAVAEKIDSCMARNQHFKTFLVQRETDNKVLLSATLQSPLKRLSYYYLLLEELMQYTPDDHPDRENLRIVTTRLKELVIQQNNDLKTLSRSSSRRSVLLGSGGALGTRKPASPPAKKSRPDSMAVVINPTYRKAASLDAAQGKAMLTKMSQSQES